jgi:hypothetical protein
MPWPSTAAFGEVTPAPRTEKRPSGVADTAMGEAGHTGEGNRALRTLCGRWWRQGGREGPWSVR